jgi:hypothetical protein
MAATIEIENDAGNAITSANFGAVAGGASQQLKFQVNNVGDQTAMGVIVSLSRLASNDGIDFAGVTTDSGGNPQFTLPYSPTNWPNAPISLGDMAPGAIIAFWCNVAVPVGASPAGNPRQFNFTATYTGT